MLAFQKSWRFCIVHDFKALIYSNSVWNLFLKVTFTATIQRCTIKEKRREHWLIIPRNNLIPFHGLWRIESLAQENTNYLWEKEKIPKSQGLVQLLLCISYCTTGWDGKGIENVFAVFRIWLFALWFLSSQEEFEKAMKWYESTLKLQPEFAPAKNRIRTIQCHLLLKKERRSP